MPKLPAGRARLLRITWLFAGLFWGLGKMAGGATPDFREASLFGVLLQEDYLKHHTSALVDRLDDKAIMRRIFTSLLLDDPKAAPLLQKQWQQTLLPTIEGEFKGLARFPTLIVARVIYVDDRRGIECLFVDPKGQFQVLILYLTKTEAGDIKIEDFRLAAHYLEFCRMMRHLLLVTRIPLPGVTDLEEINLEDFGKRSSAAVNAALQATAAGKWEEAFKSWDGVAPQMKTSRLWRDVRINLAFAGSVMAMADLQRDCRQGVGGNAFARLLILSAGGDKEVALAELEKVLIEYHELAFFRAMKADLLVELGRAAQALPLVLETIALCPRTPSAYLVGIRAATILGKQSLAMQLVRDLSQVIAGNEVDHLIESFSDLVQLRAVPEYQTWKKELLNKTSTTSSPAEKPTPRD